MVEGVGIRVELGKERIEFRLSGSHHLPRSRQFFQFRSRAVQPVRHSHLAVHRRRYSEMLLRLLALARALVDLAEAEVAVGDEGAHAEFAGERERLAVGAFNVLGAARRRDVTGETESVGVCHRKPCNNKMGGPEPWQRTKMLVSPV